MQEAAAQRTPQGAGVAGAKRSYETPAPMFAAPATPASAVPAAGWMAMCAAPTTPAPGLLPPTRVTSVRVRDNSTSCRCPFTFLQPSRVLHLGTVGLAIVCL